MSKPKTFQELATNAPDVGVTIVNRHGNSFYSIEPKKDKVEFKKNVNFSKNTTKEAMSTSTTSNSNYGKAYIRAKEEALIQGCNKEASYNKGASGKEVPIS